MRLVHAIGRAERSDDAHVARLILLLDAAAGRSGTKPVAGIMKLAKIDFLLRYPNCLERVLESTHVAAEEARIADHERLSIEAKMIRFRYGPWDSRYRRWIALLVAKGIAHTYITGRTVNIVITPTGREVANTLAHAPDLADLAARSKLIHRAVGGMSATRLKDFIYETFPEILDMRWGAEIEI
jgi:hypothetical protein